MMFLPLRIASSNGGPQNDLCLGYKTSGHKYVKKSLSSNIFKKRLVRRNDKQTVTVTQARTSLSLRDYVPGLISNIPDLSCPDWN